MMKKMMIFAGALMIVMLGSGCSSLSLFSSKHTHYHGTKEQDQRIAALEKRIVEMETEQSCDFTQNGDSKSVLFISNNK